MTIDVEAPMPTAAAAPRIARVAVAAARTLLGVALIVMVAINVINAVCRYVFGVVFPGADEILVFMMIWLVMVGLILVTAERRNIALDFLASRVGPRARLVLSIIQHSAMTAACAFATVQCWIFVGRLAAIGQTSVVNTMCHLHTPITLSLARIGVGWILGCILGWIVWGVLSRVGAQRT